MGPGDPGHWRGRVTQGEVAMTEQPNGPDRPDHTRRGSDASAGADPARPEAGRTDAEATVDEDLGSQGTPSA